MVAEEMVEWAPKTVRNGKVGGSPKGVVFSAKLPKLIAHEKHLDPHLGIKGDLSRLLEVLELLSATNSLGCVLVQLPPSFSYSRDLDNFKAFLEMIPSGTSLQLSFGIILG